MSRSMFCSDPGPLRSAVGRLDERVHAQDTLRVCCPRGVPLWPTRLARRTPRHRPTLPRTPERDEGAYRLLP